MATYIKYFTNPTFKRTAFADMLKYKMNVSAGAVDDGVIIDRDAFNATPRALMPEWAQVNSRFINSGLHTRAATEQEIFSIKHPSRYQLKHFSRDQWWTATEGSLDEMKETANAIKHADYIAVVDITTGEIVYEVEL